MASQHPITLAKNISANAGALAKTFNTLDVEYLVHLITDKTVLVGDRESSPISGKIEIISYIENLLNLIGSFHGPTIAEVAKLKVGTRKYQMGVAVELDDSPLLFIAVKNDKVGLIKEFFVYKEASSLYDVEFSGDRPGFDASRYESNKEGLWAIRKEKVNRLSKDSRPHFVAVIHENQDPARILLILDELTSCYSGSTCELLISKNYTIENVNNEAQLIKYQTAADKAIEVMGTAGFPTLGVMLNGECIRPGYRSWHPDEVISDLSRMGVSRHEMPKLLKTIKIQ